MSNCFANQLVILTSIIMMERIHKFIVSNMSHCFAYHLLISDQYHKRGKNIHMHCLQYVTPFRISIANSDQYHKRGNNIQIQYLQYVTLLRISVGNSDQYHNRWKEIYKFNASNMSHCFAYQLLILTSIINVEIIYKFNVSNMSYCIAYQLVIQTGIITVGKNIHIQCLQYVTLFRISIGNSDQYQKRRNNVQIQCLQYVTLLRISIANSDQYHKPLEIIFKFIVSNMSHCFGYQFLIVTSILNVERIYKFTVSNMSHCFAYQSVILTSIINVGKNIQIKGLQYVAHCFV